MNLPEWLHCNKCKLFLIKPENPIAVGECGCTCCCKCLDTNPRLFQSQNITKCPACSSPETLFVAILDSVPSALEKELSPFDQTLSNMQDVYKFHQKNTSELIAYLKTTCGVMQMRLREYMDAYQDTQSQLSEALEKISHLERQILGTRQGYAKPSSDVIVIDQTQSQSGSVSRNGIENRTKKFALRPSSQSSSRSSGSSFKPYLGKRKENSTPVIGYQTPSRSNSSLRPSSLSSVNPRFASNPGFRAESFGHHNTPSISRSAKKSDQFIVRSSSSSGFGRAPQQNTPKRRMPY